MTGPERVILLWIALLFLSLGLAGCSPAEPAMAVEERGFSQASPTPTLAVATGAAPTAEAAPAVSFLAQGAQPIPRGGIPPVDPSDPLAGLRIDDLAARTYGGPGIVAERVIRAEDEFIQYEISYESDGLRITGLANFPVGSGPFPVIILCHGYFTFEEYQPGFDTWRMGEWLVNRGYITVMPDYRNFAGSDSGPNPFQIGYALDLLNLIAQIDSLPLAAPGQIGIIGHSMGGEISYWPMVLSEEVDAIVLYAAMSGDLARNWEHARRNWPAQQGTYEAMSLLYGDPTQFPERFALASPINYLDRVRMPVDIHHGQFDEAVPFFWAEELFDLMQEIGLSDVRFYPYGQERHGFTNRGFHHLMERSLERFEEAVRGDVNQPDS